MHTSDVRTFGKFLPIAAFVVAASACGGSQPPAQPAAESTPAAAPAPAPAPTAAKPRVFFVEPKDGATVKSPVHLVFGIEGYQLDPVPAGTPTSARPGMGHHHLGIDQDCLPAGTTIVKGTPSWVHFGTGSTTIDTQLEPGKHKLTLQLGDDLHKTIEGLCETINITVEK
jgi:hypothetical protein